MCDNLIKKIPAIAIILIFAAVSIIPNTTGHLAESSSFDGCNDNESLTDIPTWYENDVWMYSTNFSYSDPDYSFIGTIPNLKNKVLGITTVACNGTEYEAYHLKITGSVAGNFKLIGIVPFSLPFTGDLSGHSFYRISDLAQIQTNISLSGIIKIGMNIPFFIWNITISDQISVRVNAEITFDPPVENYDFPIKVGDHWSMFSNITVNGTICFGDGIYDESISETFSQGGNMECLKKNNITVPAGTFESYDISSPELEDNSLSYLPKVGNFGKIITRYNDEDMSFAICSELTSFHWGNNQPLQIEENIDPYEEFAGEEIVIHGQVTHGVTSHPIQNGNVLIEIPAVGMTWTMKTDDQGMYTLSIPAPKIIDDTPSLNETGSGGIIVKCTSEELQGYKVKTFISKGDTPDTIDPTITIEKPKNALYINNKKITPLPTTCLIGWTDITANAFDGESGIDYVEFFINGESKAKVEEPPYTWTWREMGFGQYIIKTVAYDNNGNKNSDEIKIWKVL